MKPMSLSLSQALRGRRAVQGRKGVWDSKAPLRISKGRMEKKEPLDRRDCRGLPVRRGQLALKDPLDLLFILRLQTPTNRLCFRELRDPRVQLVGLVHPALKAK
jgi:hypothetical protein